MNVTQESIQKTWDSYDVRIVEITLVSSLIASILTVIYGTLTSEIDIWGPALTRSAQNVDGRTLIIGVSCALPILKLLIRNTKYATIKHSSAFFFEFAQSSSSLLSFPGKYSRLS
jgi:hypothetical protein